MGGEAKKRFIEKVGSEVNKRFGPWLITRPRSRNTAVAEVAWDVLEQQIRQRLRVLRTELDTLDGFYRPGIIARIDELESML